MPRKSCIIGKAQRRKIECAAVPRYGDHHAVSAGRNARGKSTVVILTQLVEDRLVEIAIRRFDCILLLRTVFIAVVKDICNGFAEHERLARIRRLRNERVIFSHIYKLERIQKAFKHICARNIFCSVDERLTCAPIGTGGNTDFLPFGDCKAIIDGDDSLGINVVGERNSAVEGKHRLRVREVNTVAVPVSVGIVLQLAARHRERRTVSDIDRTAGTDGILDNSAANRRACACIVEEDRAAVRRRIAIAERDHCILRITAGYDADKRNSVGNRSVSVDDKPISAFVPQRERTVVDDENGRVVIARTDEVRCNCKRIISAVGHDRKVLIDLDRS